jgi:hypothetical protein
MGFLSLDKKTRKNNKIKERKEVINKIESLIQNEGLEILNEGYYEWKIKNWKQLSDKKCSPEFTIGNYNWELQLNLNNSFDDNKEYISLNLKNLNIYKGELFHIFTKYIFCIRNYYDPSCIYYGDVLSNYYNKSQYSFGNQHFMKKSELYGKSNNFDKSIIENDRCIIGVYVRTYKLEKEYCYNEIKSHLDNENFDVLSEGIFEWKVKNWNQILNDEFSPKFTICNHEWMLKLHNRSTEPYISLINVDAENDISVHIGAKFVTYIRNDDSYDYFYYNHENKHMNYFNNEKNSYNQKIYKSELFNVGGNLNPLFIENNTIVIGVFIRTYKYDKEQCMNELNQFIKYYGYYGELNEGFYEWKIENWNQLADKEYSPEFIINNHKWRLELYPNGTDDKNYVSLYLKCIDDENDPTNHICIKKVLYIRNYNDYSYFYCNGVLAYKNQSMLYYNKKNNITGYSQFIKKSSLFSKNENLNKSLVENGKCIIGVYLRTSNYIRDQYKDEIKELINDENRNVESEGFYEWQIDHWDNLDKEEFSSKFYFKKITFGRHTWMLQLFPEGNGEANKDYVSLYLKNLSNVENPNYSSTSHICAKAILYIRNYDNTSCFAFEELPLTYYNKNFNTSGFNKFIKISELYKDNENLNCSIINDNRCIVGVYLRNYEHKEGKSEYKEFSNILKNKISNRNYNVLEENLHEFKIENWDQDYHDKIISKFIIGNYRWELEINPNDSNYNNYVNVCLKNLDVENDDSILICTKSVIFIRNFYDYTCYLSEDNNDSFTYFSKDHNSFSFTIEKYKLFDKNQFAYKSLIGYNKCIAGVYLRIYDIESDEEENEIIRRIEQEIVETKEITKPQKFEPSSLVIALSNFTAYEYDQLDIQKDEFLVVTNWNYKDGWVYGHRKDKINEEGSFPKVFAKICNTDNNESNTLKDKITPNYRINFENKVRQLRSQKNMEIGNSETQIYINRANLFNDAFDNIMNKSPIELKNRIKIIYAGETGVDAGGLLRDFFYQLSKEIGNPNYSLLQYSKNENSYELDINPNSGVAEPNHLNYFKFIGRIMGLAIFHKQYLSLSFTLLFYKKLLNKPLEFSDLEYVDPEIYKNINWLKKNQGADKLCLTFVIDEIDCFGNHNKKELKPNGANIDVTDANKQEYINLVVKNKLYNTNDEEQLNALKEGFYEIIPRNINSIFDEIDLKYLLSGINEIDITDWEKNTDYEGYNKNDITIVYFWKCVREFDNEKRIQLLIFATGTSQVPVTGFKDLQGCGKIQRFRLKRFGTENDLPKSHTCFNRIDLPPYSNYTQLKQKLLRAIAEGLGSFEIE